MRGAQRQQDRWVLPPPQRPPRKAEGIVATAPKLARIIHGMIAGQKAYGENEAFKVTPSAQAHRLQHLHQQAAKLGLQLVPAM